MSEATLSSPGAVDVTLEHVRAAIEALDPVAPALFYRLVCEERLGVEKPDPEGAYSFSTFLTETSSRSFRRKTPDEQAQFRMQKLALLEDAGSKAVVLPDRLRSYELLLELWRKSSEAASRDLLLELIEELPLVYGPFKALKRIFKEAEAANDTEVFGALAARFDMALDSGEHGVSNRTLGYLCRRAWRYLRRVGETLPAVYPDVASDFLIRYRGHKRWDHSWIFNHIFYHQTGNYKPKAFDHGGRRPTTMLKHRAFSDAWRRSPRPLFTLLERAQSETVRDYATKALKGDFRAALRDVEPEWVARLIGKGSSTLDAFAVWILSNVPKFDQSKFIELGMHDVVLRMFDSPSDVALKYVAEYARTHARDLPLDTLILLVDSSSKAVSKLALDLLKERDARKDVGLDAWGELLDTKGGNELAQTVLLKSFSARELTPEWFAQRILRGSGSGFKFATSRLARLHPLKSLGPAFFTDLAFRIDTAIGSPREHASVGRFLAESLESLGPANIDPAQLQKLLLHPVLGPQVRQWVGQGVLRPSVLGAEFLMKIAYHPTWQDDAWVAEQQQTPWGRQIQFDEQLSEQVLMWLGDVREFSPADLGFTWLMQLVGRAEPRYHKFAAKQMTKAFLPADFAPDSSDGSAVPDAEADASSGEINIDLEGASFVFTGKLQTMQRSEAQGKVTTAGGANSNSVTKKLDYLVIGDEGSPLYGQGRKGSKQLKAEKFNEEGAGIRIISETAFLQMLAGEVREFSDDAIAAGCDYLWKLVTEAEDCNEPLSRFARTYIRHHHPEICLSETDRPVDPGAEMPDDFVTFERFLPLFSDSRAPLRELALEFAKYEFARWAPPIDGLVRMCESPFAEVREFVAKAMTCDDSAEHRRYRVDPAVLTADAVYSFCESKNAATRALGMQLIDLHPRLRLPSELFRLTESPDRNVRAFVIRTFWSLYRDRGTTQRWKPYCPPEQLTSKKKKNALSAEARVGTGAPERPSELPAESTQLQMLLRRALFELPPGRPSRQQSRELSGETAGDGVEKLRPLPARKAKLSLIQTLRDLGLRDHEFASEIYPLLHEFMNSRGKSEFEACLVAVTQLRAAFPDLAVEDSTTDGLADQQAAASVKSAEQGAGNE
ncbi:MAG: hypothetical protein Aurels2KO_53350 [Aureliella sp.]